jgi:uncharacterized protein (TIGR02145 family)
LQCGNVVTTIQVTNGGSGYSNNPTVTIGAPPTGSGNIRAAAYAVRTGDAVTSIVITQSGSGYTSGAPSVTISGGGGIGATAIAYVSNAVVKKSYCNQVAGATINDDTTTTGIEYDWNVATPSVYSTTRALIQIGDQCWMRYSCVDTPTITTNNWPTSGSPQLTTYGDTIQWPSLAKGGLSGKGNAYFLDSSYHGWYNTAFTSGSQSWAAEPPSSNGVNGRLYQWSAAMNGDTIEKARGVCPVGFHIPTDCEWMALESQLGLTQEMLDAESYRGDTLGQKIKARTFNGDSFPQYTNLTGFYFYESGRRRSDESFSFYGGNNTTTTASTGGAGWLWTSSHFIENGRWTGAVRRGVRSTNSHRGIDRGTLNRGFAYQVRCIKD